tara:strand:- start:224 stop:787 length:564 start_codon:yes stop_codon:yes gene_type:complete
MGKYNYDNLKELIEQLKEHKPKIKVSASESISGFYQAKNDEDIGGNEISFDDYKNESQDGGGVGISSNTYWPGKNKTSELIELNQSKKIYSGIYEHDAEAWYDLDALIKNIKDYLSEEADDISWDGFCEWALDDANVELFRADLILHSDACKIISYSLGANKGENNIGWNEIWEVKGGEWDFKIIED